MDLSEDDIRTIVSRKLKKKDFEVISWKPVISTNDPIGFLSIPSKVSVVYRSEEKLCNLPIFIKKLPASEFHRNLIQSIGAFNKEVTVFEKFLIPLRENLDGHPIPTCYLAREDDIVVLNDLTHLGFRNVPLLKSFPLDHCERVIETLVKLHTASIVYEIKNNCKITEVIPELLVETIFSTDENHIARKAVFTGLRAIRAFKDKYMQNYSNELTEVVFHYARNLFDLLKPSSEFLNVLCHCDMWPNNMMFRYDDQGDVAECCLLDFQLACYRPPAYDLLMLIHICTNKELRNNHYDHLINYYYNLLSQQLANNNIDIEKILPKSEFDRMCENIKPIALCLAPQWRHFVMMPDEVIRDIISDNTAYQKYYEIDRTNETLRAAEISPIYRSKLTEGLIDLFEYFKRNTDSNNNP